MPEKDVRFALKRRKGKTRNMGIMTVIVIVDSKVF
jgi:hypothetical protein